MDIQKQILTKLTRQNGLRFSEIKPEGLESDKFNYHLKQLLKKRYIIKNRDRYFLSTLGKKFVADVKPIDAWGQLENVYKVNALIFAIKEFNGKTMILFKTRSRHPFLGFKTIPGGNINKGEKSAQAALRLLQEKTGMSAEFKTFGTLRKIYREAATGEIFLDNIFYLNWATGIKGKLDSIKMEEHYWLPLEEAYAYLDEDPKQPHKVSGTELREILACALSGKVYEHESEVIVSANVL